MKLASTIQSKYMWEQNELMKRRRQTYWAEVRQFEVTIIHLENVSSTVSADRDREPHALLDTQQCLQSSYGRMFVCFYYYLFAVSSYSLVHDRWPRC